MADKAVSELIEAERITATDLFVLEQNGTAKKLTGQVLLNWLTAAADGHGGIQSIQKVSTNGLADTYRIILADTTTFDFVVTNGRGISGITKTATSGLVDTYTIQYNDGTSATFTVTNGAKGDKGDNTYTWIKYASQEPTASSHSFGDVPDNWIGIYFGFADTAPTDWTQYQWFKIKGEKGDTGSPATLTSSKAEYQVSDSGSIIPSGAWSESVPVVPQGKYLWTRTTNTFNTGSPVVSYSVSRMGRDGTGSVSSVANISPDTNGNVPLTAEHIGAVPSAGGDMTGELKMNGQPISGLNAPTANDQAANMGFVNQQVKKAAPRNLLDNSDFRNPVNQRGTSTYSANGYTIDRWKLYGGAVHVIPEQYVTVKGAMYQLIPGLDFDKVYTMAAENDSGIICVSSTFRVGAFASLGNLRIGMSVGVGTGGGNNIAQVTLYDADGYDVGGAYWVALYEGEYTAETLPEYQPKEYGAELLECRRYYQELDYNALGNGYTSGSGGAAVLIVNTGVQMRITPSIDGTRNVTVRANGTDYSATADTINMNQSGNASICEIICSGANIPSKHSASFYTTSKFALSADL